MATFVQPTAPERSGRFAYFIQLLGQTYSNLGDFDQAATLYHQAIRFADASHYVQVKAKAMTGLAEVYRQQGQPDIAQTYYHEALQLLEAIGAQCDLAETCYQLSLTYAAASGLAQTYRDRAISLFRQINAPRQIQKVIAG
jgi:tetratricopeptide (TPR) repeat protein